MVQIIGFFRTESDTTLQGDKVPGTKRGNSHSHLMKRKSNHTNPPASSSSSSSTSYPSSSTSTSSITFSVLDSKQLGEMNKFAENDIWPISIVHRLADVLSLLLLTPWSGSRSVPMSGSRPGSQQSSDLSGEMMVRRENRCEQLLIMLQCILT